MTERVLHFKYGDIVDVQYLIILRLREFQIVIIRNSFLVKCAVLLHDF
jgi:hypothetical protein